MLSLKHMDAGLQLHQVVSSQNGSKGKHSTKQKPIKNVELAEELALPPVKIHCSVLAEDAIKAAVSDYRDKNS